jgi:hypothetical protein
MTDEVQNEMQTGTSNEELDEEQMLEKAVDNLYLEVVAEAVRLRWDNQQLRSAVDELEAEAEELIQTYTPPPFSLRGKTQAKGSDSATDEAPETKPEKPKKEPKKAKGRSSKGLTDAKDSEGKKGEKETHLTKTRKSSMSQLKLGVKEVMALTKHGKKSAALVLDRKKRHFDTQKQSGSEQFRKLCTDIKQTQDELCRMIDACTIQLETLSAPTEIMDSELEAPFFQGSRLAVFAPDAQKLSANTDLLAKSRQLAVEPTAQASTLVDNTPLGTEADRWQRRREQKQQQQQQKKRYQDTAKPPPPPGSKVLKDTGTGAGGLGQIDEQVAIIYDR